MPMTITAAANPKIEKVKAKKAMFAAMNTNSGITGTRLYLSSHLMKIAMNGKERTSATSCNDSAIENASDNHRVVQKVHHEEHEDDHRIVDVCELPGLVDILSFSQIEVEAEKQRECYGQKCKSHPVLRQDQSPGWIGFYRVG